jgi:hypothetical protein
MSKDNYEILKETYAIVGRVEDKLDRMEVRVGALETWKAEMIGKLTVIVSIISVVITLTIDSIRKRLNL